MDDRPHPPAPLSLAEAQSETWDVIVIGAGMGGGLVGRGLTERGLSVLFVEKGPAGHRTERQPYSDAVTGATARQLRGYWPKQVEAHDGKLTNRYFAALGSGVGGSSVFYAAALERPEPHDLDATSASTHPTGGWPVGFTSLLPYFHKAEDYLFVHGTEDPLSDVPSPSLHNPPELTEAEQAMMADFQACGITPYQSHIAQKRLPGCANCLGGKCPRSCKMDGRSAGVEPALATDRAGLLTDCEVLSLIQTEADSIAGIRVRQHGAEATLSAPVYVLAAGSFGSPTLLLRSTDQSPDGCANSSGWVGRGLMFHVNNFFAVWPRRGNAPIGQSRAISTRAFYLIDGHRLGLTQAMGYIADYGTILNFLRMQFVQSRFARFSRIEGLLRIPAMVAERLFGNADVFVAQMEDFPHPDNRVTLNETDPEVFTFHHTLDPEVHKRQRVLRKAIRRALGRWRMMFLSIKPMVNHGHPLGTLRFGDDPATSVLDPDCKAHDLSNLYVTDGSFMPTSLGVNPSLTIAANALRVADIIADRHMSNHQTQEAADGR